MTSRQTARFRLRDATADWHERVDAVFSTLDLADRDGYGTFLTAQAAAHLPVEQALDADGAQRVLHDWPERRRGDMIRADLGALGLAEPRLEPCPPLDGPPALLGATYVLEGSRLGGAMLLRSVPAGFPTAFLSGGPSHAWRSLISLLDATLTNDEAIAKAVTAACAVFALFERSGQRFLEGERRGGGQS